MPELPEVEAAMETLRRRAKGRTIAGVELLHPALERRITPAQRRALVGARIARVERRGKHQLLHLEDGRILHVHFRMNGDWAHGRQGAELPKFARAVVNFGDGTRLIFVDSRMLGTMDVHPADTELDLEFARPSRTTDVAISRAFFDRYDTSEVRPEPLRVRTPSDAVVFAFAAAPAGRATFSLLPSAVGSSSGTVTVTGGTPVHVKQLVYP